VKITSQRDECVRECIAELSSEMSRYKARIMLGTAVGFHVIFNPVQQSPAINQELSVTKNYRE